jgi:hypothetical protein
VINRTHLLIAFALTLIGSVVVALVPGGGDVGGQVGLADTLGGLTLILGGAIAGAQLPK